MAYISA